MTSIAQQVDGKDISIPSIEGLLISNISRYSSLDSPDNKINT